MTLMRVKYLGDLRTEAEHVKSGTKMLTDAPTDNNGKGEAFSPTDLVATALATCMITTMGIVARRDSIDIAGLHAEVEKIMAASPRKVAEIRVALTLPDSSKLNDKEKELMKKTAHSCPVALSLDPSVKQTVSFNF